MTATGSTSSTGGPREGPGQGGGRCRPADPGDPPGVLLLHGLASTAWSWAPVARRLTAAARVVAMDLRGHGLSDSPTEGYEPDAWPATRSRSPRGPACSPAGGRVPAGPLVLAGHRLRGRSWRLGGPGAGRAMRRARPGRRGLGGRRRHDRGDPRGVARDDRGAAGGARVDGRPGWPTAPPSTRRHGTPTRSGPRGPRWSRRPRAGSSSRSTRTPWPARCARSGRTSPAAVLPGSRGADRGARRPGRGRVARRRAARGRAAPLEAGRSPIRVAAFPERGHNLARHEPGAVAAAVLAVATGATMRP